MDVVVAGGHGKIGIRLLRLLADGGHRARGLIRNPDHAPDLHEQIGLLLQLRHRPDVAVAQLQPIADLHHVVDDVVEHFRKGVDVFTIERRDERRVEAPQDVTG